MTKSDLINVTFVNKDSIIKEMLLAIKSHNTIFLSNNFLFFHCRMEVEDKLEPFNPWNVEDIDQFLNYCCPECDAKQKTKSEFIVHAIYVHPKSRNYLPLIKFEEEKDNEQIIDPKGETNVSNLEFIEDIYEDHKLIIKPSEDNFIECADCCEPFENNVDYNSHYYAVHVKDKTQDPLAIKIIQPTKRKAIEPLLEILENDLSKKKVNNVQCIDCQNVFHQSLLEKHKKVCPNQKHYNDKNPIPSASGLQKKNQTSETTSDSNASKVNPKKQKLIQQQLVLLLHADRCLQRNGKTFQCNVPHCPTMKNVITHIETCESGTTCKVPYCPSSVRILRCWKSCSETLTDCSICLPLKTSQDLLSISGSL